MKKHSQLDSIPSKEDAQNLNEQTEKERHEVESLLEAWSERVPPKRATPDLDADFTLEDGRLVDEAMNVAQLCCLVDVVENGNPIVAISDGLLGTLQCRREDVLWKHWNYFLDGEYSDGIFEALQSRVQVSSAVKLVTRNASRIDTLGSFVPIFDHNRHITKYICCFHIIPSTHSELFHNFAEKVHGLVQACMVVDCRFAELPILMLTHGCQQQTGYKASEMLRSSSLAFCGKETSKASIRTLLQQRHSTHTSKTSILFYRKDATPFHALLVHLTISACALEADRISSLFLIIVDVTVQQPEQLQDYTLGRVIGSGASGAVRIAKNKKNSNNYSDPDLTDSVEIVAVKIVDAHRFRSISEIELVQDEISALSTVKHENIINLHEVIFKDHVFYFIMDFAAGGSLAHYLHTKVHNALSEDEAKTVFCQMVSAVAYCHRRRVVHRDLKPENILRDQDGKIQVADFGLSAIAAPFGSLATPCGTPEFIAPEVLTTTEYDGAMADIWSLGVILYEILTGKTPFQSKSKSELYAKIQGAVYQPLPDHLSPHCHELVQHMLIKDPQRRITMEEILTHPWLRDGTSSSFRLLRHQQPQAEDSGVPMETKDAINGVHESAKLTLGDWGGDEDAISKAIVTGDYSRSPSIVIVRNQVSEANQKLSEELEQLRLVEGLRSKSETTLAK